MIILGISDSHEGHGCIVRDGELVATVAEERLSRLKGDMGYPRRSIDAVLEIAGIDAEELDLVAFAGGKGSAFQRIYKQNAVFSVHDWVEQNRKYWGPLLLEKKKLTAIDDFDMFHHVCGSSITDDPYFPFIERARCLDPKDYANVFNRLRVQVVVDHLGIDPSKVHFYRHEDCHKAYGFYSSPHKNDEALVFTLEGGGDDSSATVSTVGTDGISEHWRSNEAHIGRLYRYVTLILGMKPAQHEYKVMGLAPYGTEYHGKRSLEFFRTINKVVGTEIRDNRAVPDLYYSVRDALEGERFDGIAWGVQSWLEEVVCEWVANNCEAHEIDTVIFSGGVAQNIKACQRLVELAQVRRFWVGPAAGDGSLGIGAAWLACRQLAPDIEVKGLSHVYLGTEFDSGEVHRAIERHKLHSKFKLIKVAGPEQAAGWLEEGHIVARFCGQMEFGQRALGNRSILGDPRKFESVERINKQIKYRDFWMPFTPSMMFEEAERMLINPKRMYSPFMTMAFDLKSGLVNGIPAVVHPADKTVRPQMLKRQVNPNYYDLLSAFKQLTGIGVLLNTSFNLHGDPIVESPDDAIRTFEKSDLDILLFDDIAVARVDI